MGLTLIEAAKYESRLEHLAVIKTFSEGELLSRLPFMNIAGGGLFYSVEKELPSVGFRAVNEGYKQSYGVVDPQSEAVHLFGGDVDVDRSIVDLQGPEARASQAEMKVRSMRLTLEVALINGDATANQGRGFDGLAKRLTPGTEMALNNGTGRTSDSVTGERSRPATLCLGTVSAAAEPEATPAMAARAPAAMRRTIGKGDIRLNVATPQGYTRPLQPLMTTATSSGSQLQPPSESTGEMFSLSAQGPRWPVTMPYAVGIPSAMTMANQLARQHKRETAERALMAWIRTRLSWISLIGWTALVLLLFGALLP